MKKPNFEIMSTPSDFKEIGIRNLSLWQKRIVMKRIKTCLLISSFPPPVHQNNFFLQKFNNLCKKNLNDEKLGFDVQFFFSF